MSQAGRKVLSDALALPPDERLELATELLESVEGSTDQAWEEAWKAELDVRVRAAELREEPGRPWSEVRERIRERLSSE